MKLNSTTGDEGEHDINEIENQFYEASKKFSW
jgi:hypothetical protein